MSHWQTRATGNEDVEQAIPIRPAASFHILTPFYDLLCQPFGLGRRFQADVVSRLNLRENERLLDVGCGSGTLLAEVLTHHPGVWATGVDADAAILRIARRRCPRTRYLAELILSRAEALPFGDSSFDAVVSTLAFHHMATNGKRAALRETYRVLRPGGRLLLVDFGAQPGGRPTWWQRLIENVEYLQDHVRGRIPTLIAEAGFRNVEMVNRRWLAVEYWLGERI